MLRHSGLKNSVVWAWGGRLAKGIAHFSVSIRLRRRMTFVPQEPHVVAPERNTPMSAPVRDLNVS